MKFVDDIKLKTFMVGVLASVVGMLSVSNVALAEDEIEYNSEYTLLPSEVETIRSSTLIYLSYYKVSNKNDQQVTVK